jgi:hypothetical protein
VKPRWRTGCSLIVLFVLAGAPAVAAACAAVCDPLVGGLAATHHGQAAGQHQAGVSDCHSAAASSAATSVLPANPCDDHSPVAAGSASLAAGREDTRVLQVAQALDSSEATPAGESLLVSIAAPGTQPTPPRPTSAPLVLRI